MCVIIWPPAPYYIYYLALNLKEVARACPNPKAKLRLTLTLTNWCMVNNRCTAKHPLRILFGTHDDDQMMMIMLTHDNRQKWLDLFPVWSMMTCGL